MAEVAVPTPVDGLTEVEADGELLLLDPRAHRLHHLDRIGSIIWSVLDGEATTDELVDDLADAFSADPSVVRHDLEELLADLERVQLIEGDDREPPADHDHAHAHDHDHAGHVPAETLDDGVWRPNYLVDPPAP